MTKEVILMESISGLGDEGQVVKVADGYARNYLLPKNLAAPVTETTRRRLEKKRKERGAQLTKDKDGAVAMARTLENVSCTVTVKTGGEGKLFGSVTAADILAALKEQNVELKKNQLLLEEPLRELGVFKVPVKLHPDVDVSLKVWVVEE